VSTSLLILDDDELVGILIDTVGRLACLPSRLTSNHEAFFAALSAEPPSHIVIDLTMPGMTGEAVLQALAERGCAARVMLVSGAGPQRLAAAASLAQRLGLDFGGALAKPFTPAALRQMLQAG
jgi:DNA-binding NtrC family response regulator